VTHPSSLSALLAWYRAEVGATIPQRIHSRETAEDGDPEWHNAFRRWLTAHPSAEDRDGQLVSPLRFWLWRLGGSRAAYLRLLAYVDCDVTRAANLHGIASADVAHDYTRECLRRLYRLMYAESGVPNEPRRDVRRDCAEPGCPVRTTRLRCPQHEQGLTESARRGTPHAVEDS